MPRGKRKGGSDAAALKKAATSISKAATALRSSTMARGGSTYSRRRYSKRRKGAGYWYFKRKFPYADFYQTYHPRTDASREKYGTTWRAATEDQRQSRNADGMRGRGLYTGSGLYTGRGGFWGSLGKGLLDVGQSMATDVNPLLGAAVGGLRKATGIGAYSTAASNHIVNAGQGAALNDALPVRVQKPSETGSLVVSHTEFVSNIYAPDSSGFSKQDYLVNPGLESTFKWLASIAGNYKEYELVQCIFSFKSTVSDFQTQHGVVGTICMASEYNVGDKTAQYDTKQELMSDISAVSAKVTNGVCFGVECDPAKLKGGGMAKLVKYIRTKGLRTHQDQEDFDWCRLTVATSDVPSELFNRCLGELHVTYTVKLHRPSIKGLMGANISQSLYSRDDRVPEVVEFTSPSGGAAVALDLSVDSFCEASANAIDLEWKEIDHSQLTQNVVASGNVPAATGMITCCVFPAQLEGTYKLKIGVHCDNDIDVGGVKILTVPGSQITAIKDINLGLVQGAVVPSRQNAHDAIAFDRDATSGGSSSQVWVEVHIRVQESIAGVDNVVGIQFGATKKSGATAEAKIKNQYVCIEEYNTDCNEEDTGRPEWVNRQDKTPIITS